MLNSVQEIGKMKLQNQPAVIKPVNFRGAQQSDLERTPANDEVNITQKKGMSKGAKWGVGILCTLGALAAAGICIAKHDSKKLAKLCKEKIVLSNLPEHIDFKEAKTLEEAIKYAKETLGIKKIEGDFSLDALNFVNKGITDVSNAYKGNLYIPNSIRYLAEEDGTIASACLALKTEKFGQLTINKKFFENEFLNKLLSDILGISSKSKEAGIKEEVKKTVEKADLHKIADYFGIDWSPRFKELANKFKKSADSLTITEKRELYQAYSQTSRMWTNYTEYNPTKILEVFKEHIEKLGINFNIDEIAKMPLEQQKEHVYQILTQFKQKTGGILGLRSREASPFRTIYHEMGHLQDYAKNLENLSHKNSDWGRMKQIFQNKGSIDIGTDDVEFVANRWNKISDGNLEKMLKDNPDKLKKFLPDLYEHITNEEIKKTAGEVSAYATKGVGEFVAEVHAGLIEGKKFSNKVIDLYKKYNGPIPATINI